MIIERGFWLNPKINSFIILGFIFLLTGIFALIGSDYFMDFLEIFVLKNEVIHMKLFSYGYLLGGTLMIISSVFFYQLKKVSFFLFFISFSVIILSHSLINLISTIVIGIVFFFWFLWIIGSRKKLRENKINEEKLTQERNIANQIVTSDPIDGKQQIDLDERSKNEKEGMIELSTPSFKQSNLTVVKNVFLVVVVFIVAVFFITMVSFVMIP